jgi:hypothetical protein
VTRRLGLAAGILPQEILRSLENDWQV